MSFRELPPIGRFISHFENDLSRVELALDSLFDHFAGLLLE